MKASRIVALLLVGAGLAACALLPKHHVTAKITPTPTATTTTGRPDDGLYASAVRAIDARDYATALDILQVARERDANDIRVLNAFGVVYDKLGRFDLSSRFYAQAAAIDPSSRIVKENLAYSALLQQREAHRDSAPALASAPAPKSGAAGRLVRLAPGVVRLERPIGAPAFVTLPRGITGHPLALVDASGGPGIEPVRVRLERLGWTAPRVAVSTAPAQSHSEIIYPATARVVALALARTLPGNLDMVVCTGGCEGVRLVLGSDSASWKRRGVREGARRA